VITGLAELTVHVQLEDMRDRVHKHLRLGEGQLDFGAIFAAFDRTRFSGVVALEFNAGDLGGTGDELASESLAYLRRNVASFDLPALAV
jgi:sugar phosphate isomerase/epimerase